MEKLSDAWALQEMASTQTSLVMFSAPWCGPCKLMKPMLTRIEEMMKGDLRMGEVDIDASPDIAMHFHVRSAPTLMIFRDGQPDGQLVGSANFNEVMNLIKGI